MFVLGALKRINAQEQCCSQSGDGWRLSDWKDEPDGQVCGGHIR